MKNLMLPWALSNVKVCNDNICFMHSLTAQHDLYNMNKYDFTAIGRHFKSYIDTDL